jgi:hypothetical protein
MNNVVSFPRAYISIERGRFKDAGTTLVFWLDLIEPDGSRDMVWSGDNWLEAAKAAVDWRRDGFKVVDNAMAGLP